MNSVKFKLTKNLNGLNSINLIYNYSGQRFKMATGEKVQIQDWNFKTQRVRNGSPVNDILNKLCAGVWKIHRDCKMEGTEFTNKILKQGLTGKPEMKVSTDFLEFFRNFIDESESGKRLINGRPCRPGTVNNYQNVYQVVTRYKKKIDFADITLAWHRDFLFWMNQKNLSLNYQGKCITIVKVVLNDAIELGIYKYDGMPPFRSKKFNAPKEKTESIYLNIDELDKIRNCELDESLAQIRDLFLVLCYTGLRYSDVIRLTHSNIKVIQDSKSKPFEVIKIVTQKTSTALTIPVQKHVKQIFNKYGILPDQVNNQVFNRQIKQVCKLAGIETWKRVSSHSGRRSFATNLAESGMSQNFIMGVMGWKTAPIFLSYIKTSAEKTAEIVAHSAIFRD